MGEVGSVGLEGPRLPVDSHVHFHRLALVDPTLEAAAGNFLAAGARNAQLTGMLLLAEAARERIFEQLAAARDSGGWQISAVAEEPQTLIAASRGRRIALVCGRQVRCSLGLEVLALGTTAAFPEGRPVDETIERVRADGALAVLPWGFGKWWGQAGRVIREGLDRWAAGEVFAGDNGGRLQLQGMPGLLREAERRGFRILPGTDPFPFAGDYRRVGAFGFLAGIEPELSRPWTTLRRWLDSGAVKPEPYGLALDPLRFMFNQCWIQVHNRMGPGLAR